MSSAMREVEVYLAPIDDVWFDVVPVRLDNGTIQLYDPDTSMPVGGCGPIWFLTHCISLGKEFMK